jgi:hypothetical protein
MKNLKIRLTSRGPGGAWTFLKVPFSAEQAFGTKARVAVAGTINGFAFQNSLMPNGDGTHSMTAGAKQQETRLTRARKAISLVLTKKHVR